MRNTQFYLDKMIAMRKMEQSLLVNAIIHRRDIPTVVNCLKQGYEMNEYLLFNARDNRPLMQAIVSNCSHTIEIRSGMIFTALRPNYKDNRDIIGFLLKKCNVSVNAGIQPLLLDAIRNGDTKMVQFICDKWQVVLTSPLVVAARSCRYSITKFILNKGLFTTSTLDIALCDAVFANIDIVANTERLKKIVALLCNQGATKTLPMLKMCAFKSMNNNNFEVFEEFLSFFDLKHVMEHLDELISESTPADFWMDVVADAFRKQKAVKKIVYAFRVHRRLNLARCLFSNKLIYSPSLVFTIAKHGGLM